MNLNTRDVEVERRVRGQLCAGGDDADGAGCCRTGASRSARGVWDFDSHGAYGTAFSLH